MSGSFLFRCVTLLAVCAASSVASANVRLPKIFSDHMLLQRGLEAPVWGWADAGEDVSVQFAGQTKTATADATGSGWFVWPRLKPATRDALWSSRGRTQSRSTMCWSATSGFAPGSRTWSGRRVRSSTHKKRSQQRTIQRFDCSTCQDIPRRRLHKAMSLAETGSYARRNRFQTFRQSDTSSVDTFTAKPESLS
jgi:hypothetical protein